jgi:hypothetical protein
VAARKLIVDGDSNENIGNTQFAWKTDITKSP